MPRPTARTTPNHSSDGWGSAAHVGLRRNVKSPLVTMAHPKCAPKSTPCRGPIPKPHNLPHPWTRSTYDAKQHPDPIRRFSTMHWTDRRTDARTELRPRESLTTIARSVQRAPRPNNNTLHWKPYLFSSPIAYWNIFTKFMVWNVYFGKPSNNCPNK